MIDDKDVMVLTVLEYEDGYVVPLVRAYPTADEAYTKADLPFIIGDISPEKVVVHVVRRFDREVSLDEYSKEKSDD